MKRSTISTDLHDAIRDLITAVGDDPMREGLLETPARVIRAWKEDWCRGYQQHPAEVLKCFDSEQYDEMVFQGAVPFFSSCEHHMTPFFGLVHIGYIPDGKVVGLSKLARVVEIFSKRLQIQERLTQLIADALMTHLKCKGAGVIIQARHLCLESRGVQKVGTITVCSALRGLFKEAPEVRSEFLSLAQVAMQGVKTL